jgi:RNA ligase (TIGR02306 family)
MSEYNPSVVAIEKVEKHPDADRLSIYTVLGDYPVVDQSDKYAVGSLAGYLPIDCIVPDTEDYYFLCPVLREQYEENGEIKTRITGKKYELGKVPERNRVIKAKKIRGIYSQGMLVNAPAGLNLGDSLVEPLGLKRMEEDNEENIIVVGKKKGANAAPAPKGFAIPHYDVDGLRKYHYLFQEGEEVVITEKINGSNFLAIHDGEQLHVKSRNFWKKRAEDDAWWSLALRLGLEEKLAKYPFMGLFGELAGAVKGFRYGCEVKNGTLETKLVVFDIYNAKKERYLDYDDMKAITKEIDVLTAPELYRGPWLGKDAMYPYAEGKTMLGGAHVREGFVVKPVIGRYEAKLYGRLQTKLIGEGFNLAK